MLRAAGVPTAETLSVARPPCVVKADGLAAGKGVFVCRTQRRSTTALRAVAALGGEFVIEELLEGEEVSLFALSDGVRVVPLGAAQDFKRIGDGDSGPNTGGMGAYSPVPWFDGRRRARRAVHKPVIDELARRGTPFVGCLFAGLMLTADGPKVLEFNARFGDPETQVLLPRLEGDLLELLLGAAVGDLSGAAAGSERRRGGDRRAGRARLPRPQRLRRRRHQGRRECRGRRRARLPRRHCGTRRHGGHERRQNPLRDRYSEQPWRDARARAYAAVELISFEGRPVPDATSRRWQWLSPSSGILVGSESDRARMQAALDELDARGIAWEFEVRSAHGCRTRWPSTLKSAQGRGLKVLICGAGLAAALPGVVAAHTELPVIGVPLRSSMSVLDGLDALLSIVQMPPGVPVATVGVDNAKNAAVLAARILALV